MAPGDSLITEFEELFSSAESHIDNNKEVVGGYTNLPPKKRNWQSITKGRASVDGNGTFEDDVGFFDDVSALITVNPESRTTVIVTGYVSVEAQNFRVKSGDGETFPPTGSLNAAPLQKVVQILIKNENGTYIDVNGYPKVR